MDGSVINVYTRAVCASRGINADHAKELESQLLSAWASSPEANTNYFPPEIIKTIVYGTPLGNNIISNSVGNSSQLSQKPLSFHVPPASSAPSSSYDPYFGPSATFDVSRPNQGSLNASTSPLSSMTSGQMSNLPGSGINTGSALPASSPSSAILQGTRDNPVVVEMSTKGSWLKTLVTVLWMCLLLVMLYNYMKMGGGVGPLASLTNDISEEVTEIPSVKFSDVMGVDEAKHELEDVVDFLRDPERFRRLGAKVPRGLLLTGPPGTGKTLLARAVAGEAGCKFYSKSASEFEEMLVGLGARRVRDLFAAAKKNAPAIIFIDELDAMGAKRRVSAGASNDRQTLNQLLASMDGFSKNENVIVIAATNTPDMLDPALIRPGRFDVRVNVPLPDVKGRKDIFDLYLSKVVVSPIIDSELLARATPGFSGAQIEAMINSAALMAAQRDADFIEMADMEEARDKIIMGPGKRSKVSKLEQLKLVAFHEAGHTLASLFTKGSDDLHKVTILPRGFSGGATYYLPKDDELKSKTNILAAIDTAMGGRVAEELVFGPDNITTGAGSDMQNATRYARAFCMSFSMSSLGLSSYNDENRPSPDRMALIDAEVEEILQDSYKRVFSLLSKNRSTLDRLANTLLEYETLSAEEVKDVVAGKTLPSLKEKLISSQVSSVRKQPAKANTIHGNVSKPNSAPPSATPPSQPPSPPQTGNKQPGEKKYAGVLGYISDQLFGPRQKV
jgi:ATP-dependent metalloprotease FtsH